ncbi:hypothetical protein EOD41_18575 [Mucilaginibacter limnophilus]|uniref:Uncharacterized protein n=1 Tax=Mucilaginibacter limnophilus TaxID=1932778 RepID=A0A3S2UJ42_9SPHI|nr:hypothetical protein [Mucilaginibacter limnophilus]RVT98092.1 hypothetical protein EOD41_18575 [Mucilaginibacter limnophilus]
MTNVVLLNNQYPQFMCVLKMGAVRVRRMAGAVDVFKMVVMGVWRVRASRWFYIAKIDHENWQDYWLMSISIEGVRVV